MELEHVEGPADVRVSDDQADEGRLNDVDSVELFDGFRALKSSLFEYFRALKFISNLNILGP